MRSSLWRTGCKLLLVSYAFVIKQLGRNSHRTGEDGNINDDDPYIPDEFHGVLFTEWLDIHCEYAFRAALNGDSKRAYDTLTDVANANVFYHHEEENFYIQVCWFTCAILLQDEEKLCFTARWFWRSYPFATDTFRLFAALNRLYHGHMSWYNAGPTQKYILRAIKHMDFALLNEEGRNTFKFSMMERASSLSADP